MATPKKAKPRRSEPPSEASTPIQSQAETMIPHNTTPPEPGQPQYTTPITSGYESLDVRWTVPYRLGNPRKDTVNDTPGRPLVYSSISHPPTPRASSEKTTDHANRIDLYTTSVRLIRPKSNHTGNKVAPNRTGTTLQGFSDKSRANLKFMAANSRDIIKTQFCMTYKENWPTTGKALKAHLNLFLNAARKKNPGFEYIWIGEFQTRGAPHFHLFSNLEHTKKNHRMLSDIWHRIAGYSRKDHAKFHAHPKNFIPWDMGTGNYLCKYLDKLHQKCIPDGFTNFGRWWGNSRNLKPRIIDEISRDEVNLFCPDPQGWTKLVRTLGRYHEKTYSKSTVRSGSNSRLILTGSKITQQMYKHLMKWSPPHDTSN